MTIPHDVRRDVVVCVVVVPPFRLGWLAPTTTRLVGRRLVIPRSAVLLDDLPNGFVFEMVEVVVIDSLWMMD